MKLSRLYHFGEGQGAAGTFGLAFSSPGRDGGYSKTSDDAEPKLGIIIALMKSPLILPANLILRPDVRRRKDPVDHH